MGNPVPFYLASVSLMTNQTPTKIGLGVLVDPAGIILLPDAAGRAKEFLRGAGKAQVDAASTWATSGGDAGPDDAVGIKPSLIVDSDRADAGLGVAQLAKDYPALVGVTLNDYVAPSMRVNLPYANSSKKTEAYVKALQALIGAGAGAGAQAAPPSPPVAPHTPDGDDTDLGGRDSVFCWLFPNARGC